MARRHYFLGAGQGNRAARWLAHNIEGFEFHPAPNYLSQRGDAAILKTGIRYVEQCVADDEDYEVYAESQAAPSAIKAIAAGIVSLPRCIVLVQPLGLNPTVFANSRAAGRDELYRRSRTFWSRPDQSLMIAGNRWTLLHLLSESLKNAVRFNQAYEYGISQDIREQVTQIARRTKVIIIASTDDDLFPYNEIRRDFHDENVVFIELPGNHVNRSTPMGIKQLNMILAELNTRHDELV